MSYPYFADLINITIQNYWENRVRDTEKEIMKKYMVLEKNERMVVVERDAFKYVNSSDYIIESVNFKLDRSYIVDFKEQHKILKELPDLIDDGEVKTKHYTYTFNSKSVFVCDVVEK